jgi:hypothetical protein
MAMIADRFSLWITAQLHRESVTAAAERLQDATRWNGESVGAACRDLFANELMPLPLLIRVRAY